MKALLVCALLLGGCTASTQALPPRPMQPIQAQFGLRFRYADASIPLQGAVRMTPQAGSLGIIFPHGRTLGICHYRTDGMECSPAEENSARTRFMLRTIGLAVYRLLPALARASVQDSAETDWEAHWNQADAGRSAAYRDLLDHVSIDLHVTESALP